MLSEKPNYSPVRRELQSWNLHLDSLYWAIRQLISNNYLLSLSDSEKAGLAPFVAYSGWQEPNTLHDTAECVLVGKKSCRSGNNANSMFAVHNTLLPCQNLCLWVCFQTCNSFRQLRRIWQLYSTWIYKHAGRQTLPAIFGNVVKDCFKVLHCGWVNSHSQWWPCSPAGQQWAHPAGREADRTSAAGFAGCAPWLWECLSEQLRCGPVLE